MCLKTTPQYLLMQPAIHIEMSSSLANFTPNVKADYQKEPSLLFEMDTLNRALKSTAIGGVLQRSLFTSSKMDSKHKQDDDHVQSISLNDNDTLV